jgi:hypothetical protein
MVTPSNTKPINHYADCKLKIYSTHNTQSNKMHYTVSRYFILQYHVSWLSTMHGMNNIKFENILFGERNSVANKFRCLPKNVGYTSELPTLFPWHFAIHSSTFMSINYECQTEKWIKTLHDCHLFVLHYTKIFTFFHGSTALMSLGLLTVEVSRSHSDTPHSVGLFWTSDRPVAETSTWQHTTLTRDRHPCRRWDSNPQSQQPRGRRPTSYSARPPASAHKNPPPPSGRNSPTGTRACSLSRLHDHTVSFTPHSVGLLWTRDQPDAEIQKYTLIKLHTF